jgi:FKBP-type peptidyl-prolyl cis-trans isomerase
MKPITFLYSLFLGIILISSCKRKDTNVEFVNEQTQRNEREIQSYIAQKGLSMQRDANGIYYQIIGSPQGNSPDTTFRHVIIKYETRLIPGETPIDTNFSLKGNRTFTFALLNPTGNQRALIVPRGIDIFMQLGQQRIAKGQKAILLMNHTLGYGTASSPFLPPYSAIRVDLEVVDVKSEAEFILESIASKGLTITQSQDGVAYCRTEFGSSLDFIRDSSNVTVKYVGRRVLDNTLFDANPSFTFKPIGNVIQGWKIGIPFMKKGEKGFLFVPSRLAYRNFGTQRQDGSFSIFPFDPIYFEIEILDVTNE